MLKALFALTRPAHRIAAALEGIERHLAYFATQDARIRNEIYMTRPGAAEADGSDYLSALSGEELDNLAEERMRVFLQKGAQALNEFDEQALNG